MSDTIHTENGPKSFLQRMVQSEVVACISGALVLWVSFGIRQTFGVFLVPITSETGWSRSLFSVAAALYQLLWGLSQPFLVYLAERKIGFGKSIFISCIFYGVGCFLLYASDHSSGLFIFAMGVVIGVSAGGNSFPNVLASIGRRFPLKSKKQSIAFGVVSSFGSFGQSCYLPIARAMLLSIGWRYSFIALGCVIVGMSPLAYFLQTIPQKPAKKETEPKRNNNSTIEDPIESHEKITVDKEKTEDTEDQEDDSAPNIKVALKEAFSSPTFIFITLGFSVCGFHVAFISTHFPAYLQDMNIDPSLAAWTISVLGFSSMLGTIATGILINYFSPRTVLVGLYLLRAVFFVIFIFIPISITTVMVFSVFFGFCWLSTVPPTTKFIGDVFGYKYLGTLSSITFVGHQIGSFLGAFLGGVVYDQTHSYNRMWYGSIAMAIFAVLCNFLAGTSPIRKPRNNIK